MDSFQDIIAGVDFNRDDDKTEYGLKDKVISLNCFPEDDEVKVGLSFELGRRKDDSITLTFNATELAQKLTLIFINRER